MGMSRLKDEIRQNKPFSSLEEEAFLNLVRTSNEQWLALTSVLRKEAELTPTQYNALRILRGAGAQGLPCREVGERMVTREPDVTRLLDRLEDRGLVHRQRSDRDRRVVEATITDAGEARLAELDDPVLAALSRQLGHLGEEDLHRLIGILEKIREAAAR